MAILSSRVLGDPELGPVLLGLMRAEPELQLEIWLDKITQEQRVWIADELVGRSENLLNQQERKLRKIVEDLLELEGTGRYRQLCFKTQANKEV